MFADKLRGDWWRRDCEVKKQSSSAEASFMRFDSSYARTVVDSAQRSCSLLGSGPLMLLFLERDSSWRVILLSSIEE